MSGSSSPGRNLRSRAGASKAGGSRGGAGAANMTRLYSSEAPGLRVDPVVVLVLSLVFIASVFALHIYGKLTRG
ncbi:Pre protein translocase Sec Sec61-beta subunit [Basidiobolus meristosporus CBS 931.73]|uniref:Pre protein translocase Sec Sec61-beta subunit n=1 Tax=Basidiobolus meristosporus CBS 931.73 TaxID=1314790 RepID=A0A1Y1YFS4_9FUNG|nr:Pre protein translocase Sec Sec61-beta subunit [Basidiobolus meristosporus CBS 931.73]|eukprot:ORX96733.1 Pre protein translocase Sec Sec61-beta subunit [Basidiobolus meristosporus CBS 931.73]